MHWGKIQLYQYMEGTAATEGGRHQAGAVWCGVSKVGWKALIGFLCGRVLQACQAFQVLAAMC